MSSPQSTWLRTTIDAVREVMTKRLDAHSLDPDEEREIHMAMEELEVMWDELQGQAAALSRESERYAEFFDYAPDAYLTTDAGGNVREANQAAAELLGVAKTDLLGHALSGFVAEGERVKFLSAFVGVFVNPDAPPPTWASALRAVNGAAGRPVTLSVRSIPLKKSGVRGLCWLIRPL